MPRCIRRCADRETNDQSIRAVWYCYEFLSHLGVLHDVVRIIDDAFHAVIDYAVIPDAPVLDILGVLLKAFTEPLNGDQYRIDLEASVADDENRDANVSVDYA
jgi:hypothetical protein